MSPSSKQYGLLAAILTALLIMVPLASAQEFLPPPANGSELQSTYQCDAMEPCVSCQQGYCLQHAVPTPVSAGAFGTLAWQKGPWQITPYGFLAAEMIASSETLTSRPFILYVEHTGEAIGTYNAAIGQSLNPVDGEPISTIGGFGELWYRPFDCLTWHVGYGVDDPKNEDLGQVLNSAGVAIAGQRSRNTVGWTNLMWNVTEFFQLGFEVSYRETHYITPSEANESLVFHFRSRLLF